MLIMAVFLSVALSQREARAESFKLTIEQSVSRALEENRDIEVARGRLTELEGMIGEARSIGLPRVEGTGQYQRLWRKPKININDIPVELGLKNTYTAGVSLDQLLFDGGRVFKAIKAAKTEKSKGLEDIRSMEQQIKFLVRQTFYDILYTDKAIAVLEQKIKQLRAHLSSIKKRYAKGIASDYTLMRQDVEVSNTEPNLIAMQRQRDLLINSMKILLAIPMEDSFEAAGEFNYSAKTMPPVGELIEKAIMNRPDLKAERLREKSLEQNLGVEKAAYLPSASFNTTFQWQGQTDNWGVEADERADILSSTITLSWPIFEGLKTRSKVKQARAKLYQQHLNANKLEDQVVKDVKDANISLVRARQSLEGQRKSLALARKTAAIASERFEAGLMSQIELNDTIRARSEAEELYLRASFDCMVAEAALETAIGGDLWE